MEARRVNNQVRASLIRVRTSLIRVLESIIRVLESVIKVLEAIIKVLEAIIEGPGSHYRVLETITGPYSTVGTL